MASLWKRCQVHSPVARPNLFSCKEPIDARVDIASCPNHQGFPQLEVRTWLQQIDTLSHRLTVSSAHPPSGHDPETELSLEQLTPEEVIWQKHPMLQGDHESYGAETHQRIWKNSLESRKAVPCEVKGLLSKEIVPMYSITITTTRNHMISIRVRVGRADWGDPILLW